MTVTRFIVWALVLLIIGAIGFKKMRGTGTLGTPSWLSPHAIWLIAGWTFLIIMVGIVVGEWWWTKVFSLTGISLIVGFALFGCMMFHNPLKPFRYKLGVIGVWLLAFVAVWHLFVKSWVLGDNPEKGKVAPTAQQDKPGDKPGAVAKATPATQLQPILLSQLTPEQRELEEMAMIARKKGYRPLYCGEIVHIVAPVDSPSEPVANRMPSWWIDDGDVKVISNKDPNLATERVGDKVLALGNDVEFLSFQSNGNRAVNVKLCLP